jgi:SAM-dependent methyltransferase
MTPRPDPVGTAMVDYASGRPAPLQVHTIRGHRFQHRLDPYFVPTSRLAGAERAVLAATGGVVLDVGCGPARHARFLQERGRRAIGLDSSPGALRAATILGLRHTLQADVVRDPLPAGIDTALLLDGNLGLAGTVEAAARLLVRLAGAFGPNGRVVVGGSTSGRRGVRSWLLRSEYRGERGPWFRWLQLDLPSVARLAEAAGWRLELVIQEGHSYWTVLRRR